MSEQSRPPKDPWAFLWEGSCAGGNGGGKQDLPRLEWKQNGDHWEAVAIRWPASPAGWCSLQAGGPGAEQDASPRGAWEATPGQVVKPGTGQEQH